MHYKHFVLQNHRPLAIAITGGTLLLLLLPVPETPLSQVHLIDKWTHFILFAAIGFCYLNTATLGFSHKNVQAWSTGLFSAFLYAALSEGLQSFLPWRSADWMDVLANCIGVLISLFLSLLFQRSLK